MPTHYYPHDLAEALRQRWPTLAPPLPPLHVLTPFISTLYQASLLAEEGRPVECHVVLATHAHLAAQPVTLADFHLLRFAEPRPYSEQELRRLSPAAQQPASLLAVAPAAAGDLQLWGMLFSEHEWDRLPASPRPAAAAPPPALLVQVSGPGSLVFYYGAQRLLTLQRGRIDGHGFLEFPRAWGEGRFRENRLLVGPALPAPLLTPTQEEFLVLLTVQMQRRALMRTRAVGHGGLVVLVLTDQVAALTAPGGVLRPKYRLAAGVGPRFPVLVQALVRRLAALGEVSWPAYQQSHDAQVVALTVEIDHFADYLAGMMAVDGALVLTQQVDLVGFGVEIQATQVPLDTVYRALDVEGQHLQPVAADHGGTRHRAAYRVCLATPDCLAIVVSQDGNVQFVHNQAGRVVFWDQLSF